MSICMHCGFVSYPSLYKSEEEIIKHYRSDYRKKPGINNLYTCHRKLNYHEQFLSPVFDEWKAKGKDKPIVGEVGAAFGVWLNWVRSIFPKATLSGTELTLGFKKVALYEFGIPLTDELNPNLKYDLICSYKVAEHQLDVDKKLLQYKDMLKEDGLLYISVPIWFEELCNFGTDGLDLEYYYSTDHINTWSKKLFETLLKKVGLEVIRYDNALYGDTYLCKRNDALMSEPPQYENPEEIIQKLDLIKKAALCAIENKHQEALAHYPRFPLAYYGWYEMTRNNLHKQGHEVTFDQLFEVYCEPFLKNCPNNPDAFRFVAQLAMRYEKFDVAIEWLNKANDLRQNNAQVLFHMADCYDQLALREENPHQKMKYLTAARDICRHLTKVDLQAMPEAINRTYGYEAKMLLPDMSNVYQLHKPSQSKEPAA